MRKLGTFKEKHEKVKIVFLNYVDRSKKCEGKNCFCNENTPQEFLWSVYKKQILSEIFCEYI